MQELQGATPVKGGIIIIIIIIIILTTRAS
jgi:hypothetical protein